MCGSKLAKPVPVVLPTPASPPPPGRRIVLFDMDETLLCRREIIGQLNLHYMRVSAGLAAKNDNHKATINDIVPRPDFFFPEPNSMLMYLRPHVKEALAYAKEQADAIYVFSASSDPTTNLRLSGLADYFDGIFGREFTIPHVSRADSRYILRKDLDAVRKHLGLSDHDEVYILDDRPEWIDASSSRDHVVAVTPFQPSYKLYGVQVVKYPDQDDPTDTIPDDTVLMTILRTIFF
jgi:hypothetical protein